MMQVFEAEQVIERITTLTAERLDHFERLSIITPVHTPQGPRYRSFDVRRLTLICELTDDFEVNEDALVIIMSLLDQLHDAQSRLERVLKVIGDESAETKLRLSRKLVEFDTNR